MTPDTFREAFEAFRDRVDAEASAAKSSHDAICELGALYERLDARERLLADGVLADWIVSDDEAKRWDALALVRAYKITSAMAALRELEGKLERSSDPSAPYEWAKVNRLIGLLVGQGQQE
jgi:hypothetical protein